MNCGIDPGRYKIGVAFAEGGKLLFAAIIPKSSEHVIAEVLNMNKWQPISRWRTEGNIETLSGKTLNKIYIGDGTSSSEIQKLLSGLKTEVVNEYGSTLEGRKRYWKLHSPHGLWRLVPVSLRVPPRNIDDLAAWAIIKES
jgi:RNase H-fold protein (predicted Holliday junction resolvase)